MPKIATGANPSNEWLAREPDAQLQQAGQPSGAGLAGLELPAGAAAALEEGGVQSLADLTARTEGDLLAIKGIGPATVEAIASGLAGRGLTLADPEPAQDWPAPDDKGN